MQTSLKADLTIGNSGLAAYNRVEFPSITIMAVSKSLFSSALVGAFVLLLTGCPSQKVKNSVPGSAIAPAVGPSASSQLVAEQTQDEYSLGVTPSAHDQQIINIVEQRYHAGLDAYQQGNYGLAKQHFDDATDELLMSGENLKTDKALRAEFDRIVNSVETLDMDALKQGNAQSEAETSPVDVAGNVTFPVNAKIEAQAAAELKTTQSDLPLVMNSYIASFINFFENTRSGHNTIVASLERGGRYKAMIEDTLKKAGVPLDLYYLAVAESGFRPTAIDPSSGAGGMWQFMPYGTYGLTRNAWVDQRFDPVLSTEAYARLIKADYQQLGDWYLAMAAYNWGAGNVQHAVERTGYADFWKLYALNNLPAETKNYVPIILAVTIMAKHPDQYGLSDLKLDPPLQFDTVETHTEISLQLVSDITGASVADLEALNPSLLRGATPPDQDFDLRIPQGTKATFEQSIALVPPDDRRDWRFHFVKPTDTLASIAEQYHVSTDELEEVNQMNSPGDLAQRTAIVIPVARPSQPSLSRMLIYRVRSGDTLISIADRYGVSVYDLRRWNRLRGNELEVGRRLRVAAPARTEYRASASDSSGGRASEHSAYHRIRRGETLDSIAARYGVSALDLERWNHIHRRDIRAGRMLRISAPSEDSSRYSARRESRDRVVSYRVHRGDTLGSIAAHYGVSVSSLRRANGLRGNEIHSGQRLRIVK